MLRCLPKGGVLLCFLLFSAAAGLAAPPPKRMPSPRTQTTVFSSHQITPPQMASPHSPSGFTSGTVLLKLKLIYVYAARIPHIDPRLQRVVPELKHLYGFNSFQMLFKNQHVLLYGRAISLQISRRNQVHLRPLKFYPHKRQISLRVTFLYLRKQKRRGRAKMTSYATTYLRLKSGSKVAFVGPSHRNGRALIILYAKHLKK